MILFKGDVKNEKEIINLNNDLMLITYSVLDRKKFSSWRRS